MDTATTDEDRLRAQAVTGIKQQRGFLGHVAVYLVTNALLWVIWAVNGVGADGGIPWPDHVTSFWGLGVAFQAWGTFHHSAISDARVDRGVEKMRVSP